jgi:TonB family protein
MREVLVQDPVALDPAALEPAAPEAQAVPPPKLLVELPSWPRVFFANLGELVYPRHLPQLELHSAPAPFWPDVFVQRGLPWRRFLESGGYHILALGFLITLSRFLAMHPQPAPPSIFDHTEVIYYQPSEYLPPLDTRSSHSGQPQKVDPELSKQPIISVPAERDNYSQTIVSPPKIKLQHDVPLPNIVAWSNQPQLPIAPAPLVPASSRERLIPQIENSVVAPPPDVHPSTANTSFQAPQPAVIAPPPGIENSSTRQLGDLNIGHTSVIAPAPQLPVGEQRAIPGGISTAVSTAPQVVPPPPTLSGSGSSASGGRVIALNLHPAVGAPPQPPQGNRLGSFAATPEGRVGASGNPGSSGVGGSNGGSSRTGGKTDLPSGLYVGSTPSPAKISAVAGGPAPKTATGASAVNPKLMASLPSPRVTSVPPRRQQPESETKLSDAERAVFGDRQFYSLTLNMPNLNSAGGSWVIRFAELKQNSNADSKQELSAPAATRKIDPAYPLQLMRENVAGTVTLYAVIHSDGTVGNIRVLNGVDNRLDQFASQALSKWQFHPATKNGAAVDVEATFQIPFHPQREKF